MGAWTGTPKTWTAGETLLAADLNEYLRDPVAALSGTWTSYTPTLAGFTAGNGTATGSYMRVGALVMFRAAFTFGSTSAAAVAAPSLTLPVTASVGGSFPTTGVCTDSSAGSVFYAVEVELTTTTARFWRRGTEGVYTAMSTTLPFTWAVGDSLRTAGFYEAA